MKSTTPRKMASAYLRDVLKFFAKTTAFGLVGFIKYNKESTDSGAILYELTEIRKKKAV